MHRDFKKLLSAFNAGQVRYLIVGGYAVSYHAQPRATKGLDILIGADAENSKAVFAALAKFGALIEGLRKRAHGQTQVGREDLPGLPEVRRCRRIALCNTSSFFDSQEYQGHGEAVAPASWITGFSFDKS